MKIINRIKAMLYDNHYYFILTGCVMVWFKAWSRDMDLEKILKLPAKIILQDHVKPANELIP